MQSLLKAIIPRWDEIGWYVLFGTLALLALNVTGILDIIFSASRTDADVVQALNTSFVGALRDVTQPLNGRFGNSVIWAAMGVLAFGLATLAISAVQDLLDHLEEASAESRRSRREIWLEFFIRTGLRMGSLVALIVGVYLFFAVINPAVSKFIYKALILPDYGLAAGAAAFAAGVAIFSFCLYAAAVLLRFIALRIRVFSDQPLNR